MHSHKEMHEYPKDTQTEPEQEAIIAEVFSQAFIKYLLATAILLIISLAILFPANIDKQAPTYVFYESLLKLVPSSSFITKDSKFPSAAAVTYSVSMLLPPLFALFACFAKLNINSFNAYRKKRKIDRAIWFSGVLVFSFAALVISPKDGGSQFSKFLELLMKNERPFLGLSCVGFFICFSFTWLFVFAEAIHFTKHLNKRK